MPVPASTIFDALLAEVRQTGPPVDLSAMTRVDHPRTTTTSPNVSKQSTTTTNNGKPTPVVLPVRKTYDEYVEECNRKIAAAPRNYGGASGPSAFRQTSATSMLAKYSRPKPRTSRQVRDAKANEEKEDADDLSDTIELELFGDKKRSCEEVEITADTDLTKLGVFLGREEKKPKPKNPTPKKMKLNIAPGGEMAGAKLIAPRKKVKLGAYDVQFSDEEQDHAAKAPVKKGRKKAAFKAGTKSAK